MSTNWLVASMGILGVIVVLGADSGGGASAFRELGYDLRLVEPSPYTAPLATAGFPGEEGARDPDPDEEALNAVVQDVCTQCHNDRMLTGGLSLEDFTVDKAPELLETAEAMITKLRLDMMPPPGRRRPDRETLVALAASLEETIDEAAEGHPVVGQRALQRMNRPEYENAIRTLFGLDVDASAYLPGETISDGYDNIADVQIFSGTLLDGYLRAAEAVSGLVVGNPNAGARQISYPVKKTTNQTRHIVGTPFGTRGGISVVHTFPADGEYVFRGGFVFNWVGKLFGDEAVGEKLEISIDGERVALLDIDRWLHETDPLGVMVESEPIPVRAGQRNLSAAFVKTFDGPVDEILAPIERSLADTEIGEMPGMTTLPHLGELRLSGPYNVTGVSENPLRARVFTCRPTTQAEEGTCAREIIGGIATKAYRRILSDGELDRLVSLFESTSVDDGFEAGIRVAVQGILSSPSFIFRIEENPRGVDEGESFPLDDFDLATRLAQFLWAMPPDDELLSLAAEGELSDDDALESQVSRMLDDPRSEALATRFLTQWLRLPDLERVDPDLLIHPEFDEALREAMRRETELLFMNVLTEDLPVTELLTADYTYVNERLARHYGMPAVSGPEFRRVRHTDEQRYGVLGQGSILAQTSLATRTSPVNRGKWVMEVILGTSPPPPPPGVPELEATESVDEGSGRVLSVKERMEVHRANPTCASCHFFIDPLGLPLENFGPTGQWRTQERIVASPIDSRGEFWNGSPVESPKQLREVMLQNFEEQIVRNFTENMLRYSLGRRTHPSDQSTVRSIVRSAAENDYRVSSIVMGIATSDAFRMQGAAPLMLAQPEE
jgi:hypothetical protein